MNNKIDFKQQVLNIILKNLAIIAKDLSYLYLNKNIETIKNKEVENNV